ncbi:MAG: hypothetical protein U1E65_23725 [Myxococcota bacterium]
MRAEAHIPQADEALRVLFLKFKEDPGSSAFEDLADALLARGHAGEARLIAEHGLQIDPQNANGRVHRAAALLAQGHARMAYVELLRALALEPSNHRGMRLLGRVYVEAGLPERAAQLLAQRHINATPPSRAPSTVDTRHLIEPAPPPPIPSGAAIHRSVASKPPPAVSRPPPPAATEPLGSPSPPEDADISNMFASLTKDLGLGGSEPAIPTRVEVTQIMRIRRLPRDGREDELSSIEGPIVDTTQPGQVEVETAAPPRDLLFDVVTSPQFTGLGLPEDEPLFDDGQRAVQPLTDGDQDTKTIDDEQAAPIKMSQLRAAIEKEAEGDALLGKLSADASETVEANVDLPPAPDVAYLKRFERGQRRSEPPPSDAKDARAQASAIVIKRRSRASRLIWVGSAVLLLYLLGVIYFMRNDLSVWMSEPHAARSTHDKP